MYSTLLCKYAHTYVRTTRGKLCNRHSPRGRINYSCYTSLVILIPTGWILVSLLEPYFFRGACTHYVLHKTITDFGTTFSFPVYLCKFVKLNTSRQKNCPLNLLDDATYERSLSRGRLIYIRFNSFFTRKTNQVNFTHVFTYLFSRYAYVTTGRKPCVIMGRTYITPNITAW